MQLFIAALLVVAAAQAQEPPSLQAITDSYLQLDTYCDAGKHAERVDPAQPYPETYAFKRCATRDGRFKYVDGNARVGDRAKWSDGEKLYRYLQYERHYRALPLGNPSSFDLYRDRAQSFAVFLCRIVRWAALEDRGEVKFTEIDSRQENRPLAQADLWYDAPLTARFSLANNLPAFLAILFVASAVFGFLFWGLVFARSFSGATVLARRRLLWKIELIAFGVLEAIWGALAFAVRGGSGHPPAIVFVYVLAVWTAIVFGLLACFTLASYPAQAIFRRKV
jgi:hypothetical protein